MNFRLLTAKEYPRWYHDQLSEAFVPQERKPLPDILRLLEEGRYEVWGLFDEDELLSYAALWKNATIPLVLLDYLGTTRARRNEGLGSDMLSRLEQQGRPLVAEAEFPVPGGSDAENALRLRRIQFYIRNGFTPAYNVHLRHGLAGAAVWHCRTVGKYHGAAQDVVRRRADRRGHSPTRGANSSASLLDDLIKQRPAHAGRFHVTYPLFRRPLPMPGT